jgi:diguanylate cyclase (GGDEF)-like protein
MSQGGRPSLLRPSLFMVDYHFAVVFGWLLVAAALWQVAQDVGAMPAAFWVLAAMVLLGEVRPVLTTTDYDPQGVVTSTAFVLAILYLWGLWPAIAFQAFATVVSEVVKRKEPWKVLFNVGQYTLSITAAWVIMWVAGVGDGVSGRTGDVLYGSDLWWIVTTWVVWFLANNALVSAAMGDEGYTFAQAFMEDLSFYVVSTFAVIAISPLVVIVAVESVWYLPLLLLPFFAVVKTGEISREKERQSLHDSLTGMPNRKLLVRRIEEQVSDHTLRGGEPFALLMLDLDRFKEVNDTLGHHVGDGLLALVSARIRSAVRPDDVVARLGGDEFAVLLPSIHDAGGAREVAERIRRALVEPFATEGVLLEVEASIGVALFPQHGETVDLLMQHADVAMYLAKDARSGAEVYEPDRDQHSADRLGMLAGLRHAIDAGQLELHYQPKVSVPGGVVTGVEALVRWRHPERGLVPPDEFIPLAETSGLMHRLTACVVDQALAQVAEWRAAGMEIPVAVNVSARDLHGTELVSTVERGLARHGLPPEALRLELTERVLMADSSRVRETLAALERLDVSLSLDDFGTGYHSMVMLTRLPVCEIKVDRSFVARMQHADEDLSIVRSIIELAHALGLHTVAEGVETEGEWASLRGLGCDSAQGYYVARPMPADQATEWLAAQVARPLVVAD